MNYLFILFSFILLIDCGTFSLFNSTPTSIFIQNRQIDFSEPYFDSSSVSITFLEFKGKSDDFKVTETHLKIIVYSDSFIQSLTSIFTNQNIPKYHISELVKEGKGKLEKKELEVIYTQMKTYSKEGDFIEAVLEKDSSPTTIPYWEKVVFEKYKNDTLWKKLESVQNGKNLLTWKFHNGNKILKSPDVVFTEFYQNESRKSISKSYKQKDYAYTFSKENKATIVLNENQYVLVYSPSGENFLSELVVNENQYKLVQSKQPFVLYKKIGANVTLN